MIIEWSETENNQIDQELHAKFLRLCEKFIAHLKESSSSEEEGEESSSGGDDDN
jgi:hypothetical protein